MKPSNLGDRDPSTAAGLPYPPMRAMSVPEPATVPVVDRSRWSRRTHLWLFALSGLCVALSCLVFFAGDTYYWVDRILPPEFWFLGTSALMQAASSFDERRGQPAWGFRALLAGLVVMLGFGAYTVHSANHPALSSAHSPDARITAVVRDGTPIIHPTRTVIVHQNAGLLSRKWTVGCVNGDDPNAYVAVAWLDDRTLDVRTDSGQHIRARLDPAGRPLKRLSSLDDACP